MGSNDGRLTPPSEETSRRALALLAVAFLLAGLVGCGSGRTPTPLPTGPAVPRSDIARHYAPVIEQGAATDQDFLAAVNFDGNWIGNDNWQHQPTGDLRAFVYYSVIETETHWYLFYALYHPRDYTREPCAESDGCHENDMESLEVIVRKDGSRFGRPEALITLAHRHLSLYAFEGSGVKRGALRVRGCVRTEGSHPVVWVEPFGHGIHGEPRGGSPGCVIYRPGGVPQRPPSIVAEDVSYALLDIESTLWSHRDEIGTGRLFDKPFDYRGTTLPAAFDGDDWGEDKVNPPWGYDQDIGGTLQRGDFFLDPARAYAYFAHAPEPVSRTYLFNPYLEDLGQLESVER